MPAPTFLTAAEDAAIRTDATALFRDRPSTAVTFKHFVSETYDPRTGTKTRTYTTVTAAPDGTPLRAVRNAVPAREVQASAGLYQTGDLRFELFRADLGAVAPGRDDLLLDGAATYDLIDWDSDPLNLLWRITARKVAA